MPKREPAMTLRRRPWGVAAPGPLPWACAKGRPRPTSTEPRRETVLVLELRVRLAVEGLADRPKPSPTRELDRGREPGILKMRPILAPVLSAILTMERG